MREIIVINPNAAPLHDKIRTAAYCRVSSDSDEQLASFSAQVSEYTARIQKNPDWVMADIYADEGISGVSAAKRPEFQRMMADCRRKKIDRILTKSISRFARNVKECIEYIRELQSLGVSIEFEKEGIDTAFLSGEMMIAVFGSLAQEESKSISSNMRLSYKSRMERGEFIGNIAPYGYRWENRSLVIVAEEAEIVRWIFDSYLNGMSRSEIASRLNEMQDEPSKRPIWYKTTIDYILSNERYIGDALLQKKYTDSLFDGKEQRNHGECAQYYIQASHPPIISRTAFERATAMRIRQTTMQGIKHIKRYPLQRCIQCAECGSSFRRKQRKSGLVSWVCLSHDENKGKCPSPPIDENRISQSFMQVYQILKSQDIIQLMAMQLAQLENAVFTHECSLVDMNKAISDTAGQLHILSRLRARELIDGESYMSQANELNRKLRDLQERRRITIQEQQDDDALERTQEIIDALENAPGNLVSLEDGGVFKTIVDKVVIDKDKNITFRLINGLELGGFHG